MIRFPIRRDKNTANKETENDLRNFERAKMIKKIKGNKNKNKNFGEELLCLKKPESG